MKNFLLDLKGAIFSLPGALVLVVGGVLAGIGFVELASAKKLIESWGPIGGAIFGAAAPVVAALYLQHRQKRQGTIERAHALMISLGSLRAHVVDLQKQAAGSFDGTRLTSLRMRVLRAAEGLKSYEPFVGMPPEILVDLNLLSQLSRELTDDFIRYAGDPSCRWRAEGVESCAAIEGHLSQTLDRIAVFSGSRRRATAAVATTK